jgi:hypothetical protein
MKFQIIKRSHGTSLYLNDYRISGSKPWGGGKVFVEFECKKEDIIEALGRDKDDEKIPNNIC